MKKDSSSILIKNSDVIEGDDVMRSVLETIKNKSGLTEEELLSDDTKEYHINNMSEAVDFFAQSLKTDAHGRRPFVKIYGDYDGDGIGSGFILHFLCKSIAVNHEVYLPDRETDGYGIKPPYVDNNIHPGDILILADNGIAAHEAVAKALEKGCKVIILDHHEGFIGEDGNIELPGGTTAQNGLGQDKNIVVVDPHITGGDFDDYCGAGLCYKFAEDFFKRRVGDQYRNMWEPILKRMNGMASISTIADSVSLVGENRRIVRDGFRLLREGYMTYGLKAVFNAMWMPKVRQITTDDIGFTLAPAINAPGRLEPHGAQFVYETLIMEEDKMAEADGRAKRMGEINLARKDLTKKYQEEDTQDIINSGWEDMGVISVFREGTVGGLDGIRAGRNAENFGAVSFAFSRDDANPGMIKGSGRTAGTIDIKHLLDQLQNLIYQYGGHPAACGLTIREDDLNAFRTESNRLVSKADIDIDKNVHYDLEIKGSDVPMVIDFLLRAEPFGEGVPQLRFYVKDLEVGPGYVPRGSDTATYYMGKDQDSFSAVTPDGIKVVGFSGIGTEFRQEGEPQKISAVVSLCQDEKRGLVMPQIRIESFTMDLERNMERMRQENCL